VRVIVTDIVPSRLERARKWGAAAALDGRNPNIREMVMELTNGGADIVYEASSSKPGVLLASSIIRQPSPRAQNTNYPMGGMQNSHHFWPRLVFQAGYLFKLEWTPGELTGGEGAIVLKPNDRTVGDRLQVIEQIRIGNLPVGDFVDKPTPVNDAPQAYLTLRDHPETVSAIAFKW
jgi:threonine dehydrogenase-like Zn-dependent dehydrogenase